MSWEIFVNWKSKTTIKAGNRLDKEANRGENQKKEDTPLIPKKSRKDRKIKQVGKQKTNYKVVALCLNTSVITLSLVK